jgi:hypothetical protein
VLKEDIKNYMDVHGGECVAMNIEITVDKSLDLRVQRNLVLHGVIENFCLSWPHDKVEELVDDISNALDQLEE